jgi:dTDP-3-amino-3,4,6-trideoxy-alpha-D-glucose transaminase
VAIGPVISEAKSNPNVKGPPVLDLGRRFNSLLPEINAAVARVVRSGRYLLGDETEAFEAEFAAFCGRRHAVAVASGTEALRLALVGLGVGPGDEVIVPAHTAVPTAAAVCAAGAIPVPADVDPDTAGLDPRAAAAAMTERTRAVIPVHLYGRPMPIEELQPLGIPVLEDAAQAHGALDAGASSAAAAYSFYPTKNLGGMGDGGAVVTDDADLAQRVRLLRMHGLEADYQHTEVSGNSRLSEVEAAILRVELPHLAEWNDRRQAIAATYRAANAALRWQAPHARHVYHLCVVRIADRVQFRARVGFGTGLHYPRTLTQQAAYLAFARGTCPEAEAWAAECVSLPCFPELTDAEVEFVTRALEQQS